MRPAAPGRETVVNAPIAHTAAWLEALLFAPAFVALAVAAARRRGRGGCDAFGPHSLTDDQETRTA